MRTVTIDYNDDGSVLITDEHLTITISDPIDQFVLVGAIDLNANEPFCYVSLHKDDAMADALAFMGVLI